jgi:hypothetical protein
MKLSENFDSKEFACKCGCGEDNVSPELVRKLQKLRNAVGFPFLITSGMRCPEHNKAVGGKPDSAHVLGYGVDIAVSNSSDRFKLIEPAFTWFDRIGIDGEFVHLDCDQTKPSDVMWVY